MEEDKSAFLIAYIATSISGFIAGLAAGWLIWG
jgi:hypothetical protein